MNASARERFFGLVHAYADTRSRYKNYEATYDDFVRAMNALLTWHEDAIALAEAHPEYVESRRILGGDDE